MMKRMIGMLLLTVGITVSYSLAAAPVSSARCQGVDCVNTQITNNPDYSPGKNRSVGSLATVITNTLLFIVGAASVIMLIYGGIQYSLSSGDTAKIKKAKDTILFAAIGLVVALLAYAIVTFVVDKI